MAKECFNDLLLTESFLPAPRKVVIDLWATNVHFTYTAHGELVTLSYAAFCATQLIIAKPWFSI